MVRAEMFELVHPLLATVFSGAVILLLPGTLCLLASTRAASLRWAEGIAFGAAITWCALTLCCIVAFLFGLNLLHIQLALLGLNALLVTRWARRTPRVVFRRPDAAELAVLAAISLVCVLAYRVGGYTNPQLGPSIGPGWSTMEESLQISTIRKIQDAPRLRVDQVMYAKAELPTYFVPVYPFVLALIGRTAGLDPMILFDAFRFWSAALALLALYALTSNAFGRTAGMVIAFTMVALLLSGKAGQGSGLGSWGQLIPLSHIADFGMGVLLPLALAVLTRVVSADNPGYGAGIVSTAFLVSMAITHTREAAHIVSYMGATLVVAPMIGALDRRRWLRLAGLTVATVLLVSFFSGGVQHAVPFLAEHESASAAKARIDLAATLEGGSADWVHGADVPEALRPFVMLGFLLTPVALWWWRRSAGAVMLFSGMLLWWLPLHLPVVGLLLERATYSEIMMTPSRYVFHVSYVLFGLVVYAALSALDRAAGTTKRSSVKALITIGGAALAGLVVLRVPQVLDDRLSDSPLILAGLAVALGLATAAVMRWKEPSRSSRGVTTVERPLLTMVCGVVILGGLIAGTRDRTLFAMGAVRGRSHTADVERWYEESAAQKALPWSTVHMLRTVIPARSVIAADPALGLAIPLASDQYLLVSGTTFTTDLHYLEAVRRVTGDRFDETSVNWNAYRAKIGDDLVRTMRPDILVWERYYQRLAWLVTVGERVEPRKAPIFRNDEPTAVTIRLIEELRPDYVLVSPTWHQRLSHLVDSEPRRFVPVAADSSFQLYRVVPASAGRDSRL